MQPWTDDDRQFVLLAKQAGKTHGEIAKAVCRSEHAVTKLVGHLRDEGLLGLPAPEVEHPAPPETPFFRRLVASIQARGCSYERAVDEARAHMAAKARRAA